MRFRKKKKSHFQTLTKEEEKKIIKELCLSLSEPTLYDFRFYEDKENEILQNKLSSKV